MGRHRDVRKRLELISPALAHPAGSSERRRAVAEIVRACAECGQPVGERTVRRWITDHEAGRLAATGRADRGQRRVCVSRAWDALIDDEATRKEIVEKLRRYVGGMWAGDASGWRPVQRLATRKLAQLTHAAGVELPPAQLRKLCNVPRQFVERERKYRVLAVADRDAKRFYDKHLYSVSRERPAEPMDVVEGDVHPLDILVTREDGSVATPRLIAWHDVATGRLFWTIALYAKGRGVTRADVAASFIAMTQHPHWGVPRTLYVDNGGEYGFTGFVDDALRLADTLALFGARSSMTVRARPYNARAKRVEGQFSALERGVLRTVPGWIGGNRMRKKTANVGREPAPFPGDFAALNRALTVAVASRDTTPQDGLGGRSPREVFTAAVNAGWQRMDIDATALEWCFAVEDTRHIRQGHITIGKDRYTHEELQRMPGKSKVRVRLPIVSEAHDRIPVLTDAGEVLCIAERAVRYGYLNSAGAHEQARGAKVQRDAMRVMRAEIDPVNLLDELAAEAREALPAPTPESAGTIRLSDEIEAVAAATKKLPKPKKSTATKEQTRHLRESGFGPWAAAGDRKRAGG